MSVATGAPSMTPLMFPYQATPATSTMRAVPRFGHSDDFSTLFSGNDDDISDYVTGLLFIALFLLVAFVIIFITILVFKCNCCCNKVGFLSGRKFTNAKRALRVRIAFIVSALLWIIFTVLLVTQGITSLQDTVMTVANSNQEIRDIANEANRITISLQEIGKSSATVRDSLVENIGTFCPSNPNLEDETGLDLDGEAEAAIELLEQMGDFIENDVSNIEGGIQEAESVTQEVEEAVEQIAINDWQSLIILIPFILVPSFMLVGVAMAWCKVSIPLYSLLLQWFFLPLLVIMTIAAVTMASIISVAAVANADFCSGGSERTPEASIFQILDSQGVDSNDILFKVISYYISQCLTQDPFEFIDAFGDQISEAREQVDELKDGIASVSISRLAILCGRDFTEIDSLVGVMGDNLRSLGQNAADTVDLLRCDNIVPLYVTTVHTGTCSYSITGVTWTFAAFLVIAFMGLFLILFRSSYLDVNNADGKHTMGEPIVDYATQEPYKTGGDDVVGPVETAETQDGAFDYGGQQQQQDLVVPAVAAYEQQGFEYNTPTTNNVQASTTATYQDNWLHASAPKEDTY